MSNSVVAVFGSASLLVYAAPFTPSAGLTGVAPGMFSVPPGLTVPSSTFAARFWPVSETIRRRSTVGLKSTPNEAPDSGRVEPADERGGAGLDVDGVDAAGVAEAVQDVVRRAVVDADEGRVLLRGR